MRVQPVASPHAIMPANSGSQTDTRSKAIEAFNKASAPQQQPSAHSPSLNQNAISPEDMSAIKAPSQRQEDVVEASAPEESHVEASRVEPKQDPEAIRQFEHLKRQERQARLRAQEADKKLKQYEEQLKSRDAQLAAKDAQYSRGYYTADQIKNDYMRVLAEAGVSPDAAIQQLLNQQPEDPRMQAKLGALEAQIAKLNASLESNEKSYNEQQAQSYDAAVKQISSDVYSLVRQDPGQYEAIRTARAQKDVVDLIEQTFKQDGHLLSVEEAAAEVENYLVDEAMKFTRLEKIQKKLQENQAASRSKQAATASASQKQQQPMKTLTNATGSSRQLSARDRALLAFKGELKS